MATPPSKEQASAAAEGIANRLTRRAVLTARYDAGLSRKVLKLLIELEIDLRGQIAGTGSLGGLNRTRAQQARLDALLNETRKAIRSTYRRIANLTERELTELMDIEAHATGEILKDGMAQVHYFLQPRLPTEGYLANLASDQLVVGEPLRNWWEKQSSQLQSTIHSEIRFGLAAGETVDQMAARISPDEFQRLPNRFTAELDNELFERRGLMLKARRGARTLVITAANAAGNTAREAVYDANADVVTELQHLSRLDGRTSEICIARAGKRWDRATRKPIGHDIPYARPPLHPRCRSVLIPRIVGGDLPTDQSGEQYFNGLSKEDQDEIFGKGKAALFRRGEITASDLVDQSGRPISLKQLKASRS